MEPDPIERLRLAVPDSRPRTPTGDLKTPLGNATKVFCANCGKFGGYCLVDTKFLMYLCNDCDHVGDGLDLPLYDQPPS